MQSCYAGLSNQDIRGFFELSTVANSYQADDYENGILAITLMDQGNGKGSAGWNNEHSSGSAALCFFGVRDQKEARARTPCSKTCASS